MCGIDLGSGFDGKFYKIVMRSNWVTSGSYISVKLIKEHLKTHFLEKKTCAILPDYQAGFQKFFLNPFIVILKTFLKAIIDKICKRTALGVVQANIPYNVFEHHLMKQVLNELLVEGAKLAIPAKKLLVDNLANRKRVKTQVDTLSREFQEVDLYFINLLLKINFR